MTNCNTAHSLEILNTLSFYDRENCPDPTRSFNLVGAKLLINACVSGNRRKGRKGVFGTVKDFVLKS